MPTNVYTSTVTSIALDADSVATSQTPAGAGNLTLTASTVTFGTNSAQTVTIASGSNLSALTFTVTGTDAYGNALVKASAGPNNNTVNVAPFRSVTNVAVSGAAGGALTVGNLAYAEGTMYVADFASNPFSIGFGCVITNSPTYTVQQTYDDVLATGYTYTASTNTWFNHGTVAAKTANFEGTYTAPVRGVRLTLSAAGAVTMTLLQTGAGSR